MQFNMHDLYNFVILSRAIPINLAHFYNSKFYVKKIKNITTTFAVTTEIKLRSEPIAIHQYSKIILKYRS